MKSLRNNTGYRNLLNQKSENLLQFQVSPSFTFRSMFPPPDIEWEKLPGAWLKIYKFSGIISTLCRTEPHKHTNHKSHDRAEREFHPMASMPPKFQAVDLRWACNNNTLVQWPIHGRSGEGKWEISTLKSIEIWYNGEINQKFITPYFHFDEKARNFSSSFFFLRLII